MRHDAAAGNRSPYGKLYDMYSPRSLIHTPHMRLGMAMAHCTAARRSVTAIAAGRRACPCRRAPLGCTVWLESKACELPLHTQQPQHM